MKHKVCINIAKPGGTPTPVVRSGTVQIRKRLLDFLFGQQVNVLVLSPGDSVQTVEIRELKEGGKDYESYDYLIGMDTANIRNMNRISGGDPDGKIYKMLSFAGSERDVADPWYTGDFDATYEDVLAGCEGFLEYLVSDGRLSYS